MCLKTICIVQIGWVAFYWAGRNVCFLPQDVSSSIWLDCIVTAVISACIKKKSYQNWWILCSYFNIEDGRKSNIFSILCYIISRKVKAQLKCKEIICVVHGEGTVTDRMCQNWLVDTEERYAMTSLICGIWKEWHKKIFLMVCKVLCWRCLAGWCSMVS